MAQKKEIKDVGEYIPHAKKHSYEQNRDKPAGVSKGKEDNKIVLSLLWPEPDWIALADGGRDVSVLAIICGIYHRLAKKPIQSSYLSINNVEISMSMWEKAFVEVVEWLKEHCENAVSLTDIKELRAKFDNQFSSNKTEEYKKYAAGIHTKRKYFTPFGSPNNASKYGELLPLIGWPHSVNIKKIPAVPISFTEREPPKKKFFKLANHHTTKISWDNSLLPIKNEFDTFIEAALALKEHCGDVFAKKKKAGREKTYNPVKKIDANKYALKECKSVSEHQLKSDFAFRGVQFGKSLTSTECQVYIDNTYYALTLLANILGIPKSWLGSGGLGLAIAARGGGNAAAHYEPDLHVINLTRYSGPGTIAHEIFHSFDARFNRKWFSSYSQPALLSEKQWWVWYDHGLTGKDELRFKAFLKILEVCTDEDSSYVKNAKAISSQSGGRKYWCTSSELLARAFESYIQDRLEKDGIHEQWLALNTKESDYISNGMHPYPCGAGRTRIFETMEKYLPVLFSK